MRPRATPRPSPSTTSPRRSTSSSRPMATRSRQVSPSRSTLRSRTAVRTTPRPARSTGATAPSRPAPKMSTVGATLSTVRVEVSLEGALSSPSSAVKVSVQTPSSVQDTVVVGSDGSQKSQTASASTSGPGVAVHSMKGGGFGGDGAVEGDVVTLVATRGWPASATSGDGLLVVVDRELRRRRQDRRGAARWAVRSKDRSSSSRQRRHPRAAGSRTTRAPASPSAQDTGIGWHAK